MKRIVIIGTGFAGLATAKALRHAKADVLVIDRTNHNLFQPLLYQVATTVLSPAQIASPIRGLLKNQRNTTVATSPCRWDSPHRDRRQITWDNWAPVTTILAALFDRGFFLITISTSRSSALRKCISRSTEKPSNR